jgi:hypothetical protein
MAGILIFSPKCAHCSEIVNYINNNPTFQSMVQLHNINIQGLPSEKIQRVPTMITKNGKFLVGKEIKTWLESLMPQAIENCTLDGYCGGSNLDGIDEDNGSFFALDSYGQSLQPAITDELQIKMSRKVSEAFNNPNKDL